MKTTYDDLQWPGHVPDAGRLRRVREIHDPGAHQSGSGEDQGAGSDLGSPPGRVICDERGILKALRGGQSVRKIAARFGVSASKVQRVQAEAEI